MSSDSPLLPPTYIRITIVILCIINVDVQADVIGRKLSTTGRWGGGGGMITYQDDIACIKTTFLWSDHKTGGHVVTLLPWFGHL